MNILKLIGDASIIVQMILLILVFFSVFSWAIIIFKRKSLRSGAAHSRKFLNAFHKSKNLAEVGEAARKYKLSPWRRSSSPASRSSPTSRNRTRTRA